MNSPNKNRSKTSLKTMQKQNTTWLHWTKIKNDNENEDFSFISK